ncbi:MAG: protein kinase [Gemmatimonadaceae bacterium]|nr:protein kinase [Gemmatimonadaceae bacterium]
MIASDGSGASITPERWRLAAPILEAVLDLPPHARDAYIAQQCSDQPELAADVNALLAHALSSGDLLDSTAAEQFPALLPDARPVPPSIGARYVMHEALGAGGAATVYRAHDPTTRRDVAVKVLHSHLASASGRDRFLREVRIAANLSHPNIIPLYDAGQADGHAYYVMPLVSGGSLRRKLEAGGPPAPEVSHRILQEVASALAFAHAQGVVHRDIKPDNVLLADDGRAMVADFGIAKALSASTPELPETVHTVTGIAIGTPAYMAPEQVLGDANVAAGADVYAFGILAYELLAGRPPFTGGSGPEIVARHLHETPVPLLSKAPHADPLLADLVMRCLRKVSADRPTAAELVDALTNRTPLPTPMVTAAASTPAATTTSASTTAASTAAEPAPAPGAAQPPVTPPSWYRRSQLALASCIMIASATLWYRTTSAAPDAVPAAPRTTVVLADFDAPAGDSVLAMMFTDAIRAAMAQSPAMGILTDRRVMNAMRRMAVMPGTPLDVARARELAQREGIATVISGDIIGSTATGYQLSLRAVTADSGRELARVQHALREPTALLSVADTMVRQLRVALGERQDLVSGTPSLPRVTTTSPEALRKYSEARGILQRGERSPRPMQLLQEAIALDSNFAMAYVLLSEVYAEGAPRSVMAQTLAQAYRLRDKLPPAEAAFVAAQHFGIGAGADPAAAERYYRQAMIYGDTGSVRGPLAMLRMFVDDHAGAVQLLQASEARDSLDADETATLIAALAMQGRDAEAEGRLAQAMRAGMLSPRLLTLQPMLPWLRGDYAAAERVAQQQLEDRNPAAQFMGLINGNAIASTRGKLALASSLGAKSAAMSGSPPAQLALEDATSEAIVLARVLDQPDSALAVIERARRRYALDQVPEMDRPYYPLALGYAFAKRPVLAGAMVDSMERLRDTVARRSFAGLIRPLRAIIATVAGHPDSALTLLRQQQAGGSGLSADRLDAIAADAHFAAARFDSAATYYERYRRYRTVDKMYGTSDPVWLAHVLWRLGESHETRGDRPAAIAAYGQLLRLWDGADPPVAARAAEVRSRVARLQAAGAR